MAVALVVAGSCVLNDYFDLKVDAVNNPTVRDRNQRKEGICAAAKAAAGHHKYVVGTIRRPPQSLPWPWLCAGSARWCRVLSRPPPPSWRASPAWAQHCTWYDNKGVAVGALVNDYGLLVSCLSFAELLPALIAVIPADWPSASSTARLLPGAVFLAALLASPGGGGVHGGRGALHPHLQARALPQERRRVPAHRG